MCMSLQVPRGVTQAEVDEHAGAEISGIATTENPVMAPQHLRDEIRVPAIRRVLDGRQSTRKPYVGSLLMLAPPSCRIRQISLRDTDLPLESRGQFADVMRSGPELQNATRLLLGQAQDRRSVVEGKREDAK